MSMDLRKEVELLRHIMAAIKLDLGCFSYERVLGFL